jgi:rare lipoprotein A
MRRDVFKLYGWLGVAASTVTVLVLFAATVQGCAHTDKAGADEAPADQRVQHGLASFYGPGFHGEETASGETFDQREMVAAHRTLPLGTVVRVINLENRRQVVLRVIDRGPYGRNYRRGTIIDVSLGAARRLGFVKDGLVRVRVEVIKFPVSRSQPGPAKARS